MALLLEAAVRATLIAGAVGLALRVGRIATPRLAHAAWASVAAAMLLQPALVTWAPRAAVSVLAVPPIDPSPAVATTVPHSLRTAVSALLTTPASPSAPAPHHAVEWSQMVAAIYLCGVVVLLTRVALGVWQARRLLAGAVTAGSHWVHPRCAVPLTFGLWTPRVILPLDWRSWDARELAAVLTHEREHVRRRDTLIALFTLINRAIFWFHPLAWWLHRRVSELAEQACDEAVLAHGHDASAYSESLLRFARRAAASRGRVQPIAMAMPGLSLSGRLIRIVNGSYSTPVSRARRLVIGMACTLAIIAGSEIVPAAEQATAMPQAAAVAVASTARPPQAEPARAPVAPSATVSVTQPALVRREPRAEPAAENDRHEVEAQTPVSPARSASVDPPSQDAFRFIAGANRPETPATPEDDQQLAEAFKSEQAFPGLAMTAQVSFRQLNRAEYAVPISVRIAPASELAAGRSERSRLDFIGEVKDNNGYTQLNLRDTVELRLDPGSIAALATTPIIWEATFTLLPGRYTLKMLARDATTGRIGTVTMPFTIPNLGRQQAQ
jgi:hypothetical protein